MAKDSIYVIGPVEVFQVVYDEYVAKGFVNRGKIRYSLDGTKVLVEESPEMFDQKELDQAEFFGNEDEIQQYLNENQAEWEEPLDED